MENYIIKFDTLAAIDENGNFNAYSMQTDEEYCGLVKFSVALRGFFGLPNVLCSLKQNYFVVT